MKTAFLGLIMTLIFGGAAVTANAQRAQEISVRINNQKSVMSNRLRIKFVSVEDSRCPQDANCIWAGNAKVTIRVTNGRGQSRNFDLNTNMNDKSARFDGYEIALGNVTPHPRSNIRINRNGYTASFTVTKL